MYKGFPKGGGSDVWEKFPNNIVFFFESAPYHFSFCGWAAVAHSIIHPISRHSAPHLIRMCSGGGFHHKAPCSTKLLLQTCLCQTDTIEIWQQKWSPFLCQTKQVGVIVENNFFLNPEAYSDQWTDWSDTFFLSKLRQKPSNAGRPPFSPHYLWGAFDQSTCPRQPTPLAVHTSHSSVRRNIFLRSTFGTACVTLWTTFNRASTFTCHPIHDPISTTCVSPFLAGSAK